MNATAQPDLLHASMQLVTAYLSNPNVKVSAEEIPGLLGSVHKAALRLAGGTGDAPAEPLMETGFERRPMPEEVRSTLTGSVALVGDLPKRGAALDHEVWQGVPEETRAKFQRLIERFNIPLGLDGLPIPRARREDFISEDGTKVVDPIDGKHYTMLKRHLKLDYDLDHDELLTMFGLTKDELPKAGPVYSESKAIQARRAGLGKHRKDAKVAA